MFLLLSCKEKTDLTSNACGTEDPASEIEWISKIVAEFEANQTLSFIELYSYEGQKIFLIAHCVICSDGLTVACDCDQNTVCKFGGIAGFNTCPDFEEKAIFIKDIFRIK